MRVRWIARAVAAFATVFTLIQTFRCAEKESGETAFSLKENLTVHTYSFHSVRDWPMPAKKCYGKFLPYLLLPSGSRSDQHMAKAEKASRIPASTHGTQQQGGEGGGGGKFRCWKILLVVMFNKPFYGVIPFLRRLYRNGFGRHVLFYGDQGDPSHVDVIKSPVRQGEYSGLFQHLVIAQAMREHPEYDGYLYIADDLLLNYKELFSRLLDPRKMWVNRVARLPRADIFTTNVSTLPRWYHWEKRWGLSAVKEAFRCFPKRAVYRMEEVFGCEHCIVHTVSDIVYIPRQYAQAFSNWSYIMRNVYNEIAVPMFVHLMVDRENVQFFHGKYLWDANRSFTLDRLNDPG